MNNETLINIANQNRERLLARAMNGELKGIQPGTLKALEKPVTKLMRPMRDEEPKATVTVFLLGKGHAEVAPCKEVLPERKTLI